MCSQSSQMLEKFQLCTVLGKDFHSFHQADLLQVCLDVLTVPHLLDSFVSLFIGIQYYMAKSMWTHFTPTITPTCAC